MTSHLQTTSSKKKWLWGNFEAIMGIVDVLPTGWKVCQTGACPTNSTCHDLSGCCSWEGLDQCPIGRTFSHVTSFLSPLQSSCSQLLRSNVKAPFPASIHLHPQRHACAHTHTHAHSCNYSLKWALRVMLQRSPLARKNMILDQVKKRWRVIWKYVEMSNHHFVPKTNIMQVNYTSKTY